MVGFITLFGIAVRNGILLANHYAHLMAHEGPQWRQLTRMPTPPAAAATAGW